MIFFPVFLLYIVKSITLMPACWFKTVLFYFVYIAIEDCIICIGLPIVLFHQYFAWFQKYFLLCSAIGDSIMCMGLHRGLFHQYLACLSKTGNDSKTKRNSIFCTSQWNTLLQSNLGRLGKQKTLRGAAYSNSGCVSL